MSPELKPIIEAIKSGNKEKARDYLRPLMRNNPTADIMYLASLVALNPKQAKQFLEQALTIDPFHELANRAIEQLNPNGDENSPIQKEITIQKEAEEHFRLGVFHQEKGNLDKAYDAYTEAIRIYPEYADAYYRRSEVNRQKLNLRPALDDYEAAVRFNPRLASLEPEKYAVLYFNWAEVCQNQVYNDTQSMETSLKEAERIYDLAIRICPDLAAAYVYRGFTFLIGGRDPQRAIDNANEAIRLNPDLASAYSLRQTAKYELSPRNYQSDEKDINRQEAILNSSQPPRKPDETGEFFYARGNYRLENADDSFSSEQMKRIRASLRTQNDTFHAAISDFTRAIQINPLCARYYYRRGNARNSIQDFNGAISDFEHAIQLGELDWALRFNLAGAHFLLGVQYANSGNIDGSISEFSAAIEIRSAFHEAYSLRGRLLVVKGVCQKDTSLLKASLPDFDMCLEKLDREQIKRQPDLEPIVSRIKQHVQVMIDKSDYSRLPYVHQECEELLKVFNECSI